MYRSQYLLLFCIGLLILSSCANNEKWNGISTIKVEAEANATKKATTTEVGDTITSPSYDITVDMEFMDTTSIENLDVCHRINKYLIAEFLEQDDETDSKKAVNTFIERLQNIYSQDDMSTEIYDHYTGKAVFGPDGVINYILVQNYYGGGAHPTSITSILRFNTQTGEKIGLYDFFADTCSTTLCDKLTERLMQYTGAPDLDSLHSLGYLDMISMFISENFLLNKDSISFFYNQYDIAPYACGTTTLSFGYDELKDYIRK